ncbi:site-specific integrase, partial [Candidatus Parcubacteria bacterium]|nr:site-specific integrase [Candidatus Parcubacteria bacterium]
SAATKARNYAMAILAAESGLRADEILHLELHDLFFKSNKIQTRYAKGTRGSGKRARTTLFTPLARDSVNLYLKKYRHIITHVKNKYLFPNKQGIPLKYSNACKALREMIEVAQKHNIPIMEHMGWHWFRRIFATRFIERFPHQLSALVELLGHTSPNTVHRYIKHSEAWIDTKIQKILEDSSSWPSIGD